MQPELMNCPFCNGPAVNVAGEYISCGAPAFLTCAGRSVRADVEDWNTRATPTPPIEGRDADVERVEVVAKAMYDATHASLSNCYAWEDEWEPYQEARRGRYYKEAAAAIAALQALGERP